MATVHRAAIEAITIADDAAEDAPGQGTARAIVATLTQPNALGHFIRAAALPEPAIVPVSAYNHSVLTASEPPIGLATVAVQGERLIADVRLNLDKQSARDAWSDLKFHLAAGRADEWSISYMITDGQPLESDATITEVTGLDIVEVSPVHRGASADTATRWVAAAPPPPNPLNAHIGALLALANAWEDPFHG